MICTSHFLEDDLLSRIPIINVETGSLGLFLGQVLSLGYLLVSQSRGSGIKSDSHERMGNGITYFANTVIGFGIC